MTYYVVHDQVNGGFSVVEDDGAGTRVVIAKCANSTVAGQIAAALSA
jgi:hypothetical protein